MTVRRRVARVLAPAVVALALTLVAPAGAQTPEGVAPVAEHGFGDRENSYSWSMAWFKGKLYVGTARSFSCVEAATYDFFFPGIGFYPGAPTPDFNCPPDRYALDLRAEIWQYTPETGAWRRVYQSPLIPNPRAPGRTIARNIGFRGMVVYRDPDGQEVLYAGGVTAGEYIPEVADGNPPDILRSTTGDSFTPLGGGAGIIETVFAPQRPVSYRAMEVYNGRLYVSASAGLAGDGVILQLRRPWAPNPRFVQVSPSTMRVYEMASFNGYLYAGGGSTTTGYALWKAKADGPRLNFRPVLEGGAGRGVAMTSVLSMNVFRDRLYVSGTGWYGVLFPASELIRVNPDDSWQLLVGNARTVVGGGFRYPLSGLSDGFGNVLNAHLWRADVHDGAMYVGTNDMSWTFRNVPILNSLLQPGFGFDVYGTCDGNYWWPVTTNAFGDGRYNFGARTMVSTPAGEFIGSANHVEGTKVWQVGGSSPCAAAAPSRAHAARSRTPSGGAPRKLLASTESCGTVLAWERSAGARRYRVLRARYSRAPQLQSYAPRRLPHGETPDTPILPRHPRRRAGAAPWVLGPFESVGTATGTAFVDRRAARHGRYLYELAAPGTAERSNLAPVPSSRPPASFADVKAKINALGRTASAARAGRSSLVSTLQHARASRRQGDRARAVAELRRLGRQVRTAGAGRRSARVEDLADVAYRLERRLAVDETACRHG